MDKYTIEQYLKIIQIYYQSNESVRKTFRALLNFMVEIIVLQKAQVVV